MTGQLREVTGSERDVARMFAPASLAIVGASARPGALSSWPLRLSLQYGFSGKIYPINPTRDSLYGLPCLPSVTAIGEPVDVAVLAVSAHRVLAAVRECAEAGVRSIVLPAQGFGELGKDGRSAERELLKIAREAGMRILGPNTDGLGNLAGGAMLSIQPIFARGIGSGPVAVVTQSGASAGSLVSRLQREGVGCRLYASAGNEIDLGLADLMSVAVQDPGVSVILSFVEAVRRPDDFVAVARLAADLGKPIALIKVGRTTQAATRAAAHTGAMAGEDRIYESLFRSLGIIRVDELSELAAVAKLHLGAGSPIGDVGIMSVSGGQAGALADSAAMAGIAVPAITETTADVLRAELPFGSALNPCDLTGDVATRPELASTVYRAFRADPGIATIVYARKELTGSVGVEAAKLLSEAAGRGGGLVVYAMDGGVDEAESRLYASTATPVFTSARELFGAMHALRSRRIQPRPARLPAPAVTLPAGGGVLPHAQAKELLAAYGIAAVSERLVRSASEARAASEELGGIVVVKSASPQVPHKTEIGAVLLDVRGGDAAAHAYTTIADRVNAALGADAAPGAGDIVVQEQLRGGIEIIAGVVTDPGFGAFVLVGSGGVLAEVAQDSVLLPAPFDEATAREALGALRAAPLLVGYRGAPAGDADALANAVAALSRLADDHRGRITALDLNPILVTPSGAVAADILMVLSEEGAA